MTDDPVRAGWLDLAHDGAAAGAGALSRYGNYLRRYTGGFRDDGGGLTDMIFSVRLLDNTEIQCIL